MDIESINRYKLLAKKDITRAQHELGVIYLESEHFFDIQKSIHYFTLVSNNNYKRSQYLLGNIFSSNQNGIINIDKSIHYYTLAANHNHSEAQYILGVIYSCGYPHV